MNTTATAKEPNLEACWYPHWDLAGAPDGSYQLRRILPHAPDESYDCEVVATIARMTRVEAVKKAKALSLELDEEEAKQPREKGLELVPGLSGSEKVMNLNDQVVWRKGHDGEWSLFGPSHIMRLPGAVRVTKKDGTSEFRKLRWLSNDFPVDGVLHCYGRPEERRPCESCGGMHLRDEVRSVYGRGKARWCPGERDCDCGGLLV